MVTNSSGKVGLLWNADPTTHFCPCSTMKMSLVWTWRGYSKINPFLKTKTSPLLAFSPFWFLTEMRLLTSFRVWNLRLPASTGLAIAPSLLGPPKGWRKEKEFLLGSHEKLKRSNSSFCPAISRLTTYKLRSDMFGKCRCISTTWDLPSTESHQVWSLTQFFSVAFSQ